MFTVEIRINGALISHLYGHNEGRDDGDWWNYSYHFYTLDNDKDKLKTGTIKHRRDKDSINVLVANILKDIKK